MIEETYGNVYNQGKEILKSGGIEAYIFENTVLFENCFDIPRYDLVSKRNSRIDKRCKKNYFELINKRISGTPLQYLLGKCNFMGYEFRVGEGVLIPRDDTEVLVSESAKLMSGIDKPVVFDLCSGSGIIAIVLDFLICNTKAKITAIEYSKRAYKYLLYNVKLHGRDVRCLNMDIFECHKCFDDESIDFILSNPPYVRSGEIMYLQREVQCEPREALDGGKNGLDFYEVILDKWTRKLKSEGIMGLEIGIGQSIQISDMINSCGMSIIKVVKDINDMPRAIFAKKYK